MPRRSEAAPQDIEAEQSLLGSLLIDTRAIDAVTGLRPEHFFLPGHGRIFAAMQALAAKNEPTDVVLVANHLQANGDLDDVGGVAYLASVSALVPTSMHAPQYAHIVSSLATLRRLIEAGLEISRIGYDSSQSPEEALAKAESILVHVIEDAPMDQETKAAVLERIYQRLTNPRNPKDEGIMTGYKRSIDAMTSGLGRGDLVILAARPGMGKTSLSLGIAHHVAVKGKKSVLFFSLEMSRESIFEKLLCIGTQLPWETLHSHDLMPSQSNLLAEQTTVLNAAPLDVISASGWTVERIMSESWKRHRTEPVDLVIVDYLQLSRTQDRRENRNQEVATISRMLKELAQGLNAPVLGLSQLNRAPMDRKGNRPQLSDLRESGAIEQDADVVMFLSHDDEDTYDDSGAVVQRMVLDVAKNRLGPTGPSYLAFNGPLMAFTDWAGGMVSEYPQQRASGYDF